MARTYNGDTVKHFIDSAREQGYTVHQLTDSVVGYGDLALTKDGWVTVWIREVPENCWSSRYTVRTFQTISKAMQKRIDNAIASA